MPYLGVIKIAAVVMGVMIVVGIAVIGVTIAKRLSGAAEHPAPSIVGGSASVDAPSAIGDLVIPLPAGARIVSTEIDGRRIAATLRLIDGGTAILLLDAETGETLGLLTFAPAPTDR